jgi:ketol-acid reductoisomerase
MVAVQTYITAMTKRDKAKKSAAIIGYGSQGRALALNLRDSGFDVTIGLRPRSKSRRQAKADGAGRVVAIAEAVKTANTICMAFPDHLHGKVFGQSLAKNIRPGTTLWYLHGMSTHFGLVIAPPECDVILIAPHAPGVVVREKFLSDMSVSASYAVGQNHSGKARRTVFSLAKAAGFREERMIETTFEAEAIGDLFGEQAVLCGGLAALVKNGFELLVENGLTPDHAYLEVAYQLELIAKLIKKHGIGGMFQRVSVAAQYGSLQTGPKIIDATARTRMSKALSQIRSGEFARRLDKLTASEIRSLGKALKELTHPALEKAARKFSG